MKKIVYVFAAAVLALSFASCSEKDKRNANDKIEHAKDKVDKATDKAVDQVNNAADDVNDAWDDAKKRHQRRC